MMVTRISVWLNGCRWNSVHFHSRRFFIGRTEAAAGILLEIDGPGQRCPVDMGIEDGQENDDFPALLVEVRIFFYVFDADDSPICRRHQERSSAGMIRLGFRKK